MLLSSKSTDSYSEKILYSDTSARVYVRATRKSRCGHLVDAYGWIFFASSRRRRPFGDHIYSNKPETHQRTPDTGFRSVAVKIRFKWRKWIGSDFSAFYANLLPDKLDDRMFLLKGRGLCNSAAILSEGFVLFCLFEGDRLQMTWHHNRVMALESHGTSLRISRFFGNIFNKAQIIIKQTNNKSNASPVLKRVVALPSSSVSGTSPRQHSASFALAASASSSGSKRHYTERF